MLSSMVRGEIIEYLDTGRVLAKDVDDEDIMFARPGPPSAAAGASVCWTSSCSRRRTSRRSSGFYRSSPA
jgi:hypothetical protein